MLEREREKTVLSWILQVSAFTLSLGGGGVYSIVVAIPVHSYFHYFTIFLFSVVFVNLVILKLEMFSEYLANVGTLPLVGKILNNLSFPFLEKADGNVQLIVV